MDIKRLPLLYNKFLTISQNININVNLYNNLQSNIGIG